MRMALCMLDDNDEILARTDSFYCEIDPADEKTMEHYGLDLYNEVGQLMVHKMKKQITSDMIIDMLKRAKELENAD